MGDAILDSVQITASEPRFFRITSRPEPKSSNRWLRVLRSYSAAPRSSIYDIRLPVLFDLQRHSPKIVEKLARYRRRSARATQIWLPLNMPRRVVTPLMDKVLVALIRIAATRGAMPGNPDLGTLVGGRGRQSVAKAVNALIAMDKIRVQYRPVDKPTERRIIIPKYGVVTGWGEFRPGHAPFTSKKLPQEVKVRAPDAKPLAFGEGLKFLETVSVGLIMDVARSRFVEEKVHYRRCFCDAPRLPGKKHCAVHHEEYFGKRTG